MKKENLIVTVFFIGVAGLLVIATILNKEANSNGPQIKTGTINKSGVVKWDESAITKKDADVLFEDCKSLRSFSQSFTRGGGNPRWELLMKAVEKCEQAIKIKPDFFDAHYYLGLSYNDLDRYSEAITVLKEAIRIKPDFFEAHISLGNIYGNLKRYSEAITVLKEAIRIKPDFFEAHVSLGNVYGNLKRYSEAIAVLKEAIRIKPDNAQAHYSLGRIYLVLENRDLALNEFNILKAIGAYDLANNLRNFIINRD